MAEIFSNVSPSISNADTENALDRHDHTTPTPAISDDTRTLASQIYTLSNGDNTSKISRRGWLPDIKDEELSNSPSETSLPPRRRRNWNPCRVEVRKILALCLSIAIPMITFTAIVMWLVLGHKMTATQCPYQELCPNNGTFEATRATTSYYVDYPAARLAFVASWSSTISLSLVGFLTAIYSQFVASRLIKSSGITQNDPSRRSLPSPYQTSLLFRILNAEILALFSLFFAKVKEIFWKRRSVDRDFPQSNILHSTIVILLVGVGASGLIQAADTYLHVTTEAVEWTQIETQSNISYAYSRGLGPLCLDRPTSGSVDNVNYWGCGMTVDPISLQAWPSGFNEFSVGDLGISTRNQILDYIDTDGTPYALLGPTNVPTGTDWRATTLGVSVQCQVAKKDSCTFSNVDLSESEGINAEFNCSREANISGTLYNWEHQKYSSDFHRYVKEPPPFEASAGQGVTTSEMCDQAASLPASEAETVFTNPWHWVAFVNMYPETYSRLYQIESDNEVMFPFGMGNSPFYLELCNTTVWDVTYIAIASQVISITKRLSNTSTAGIASMPMSDFWSMSTAISGRLVERINYVAQSPDEFKKMYMSQMARGYAVPLGTQVSERPALAVQTRNSKIVSKVPKAALWLLVTANLLFVILAITLTVLALSVVSSDVHQLRLRLNIVGLTAQLFEGEHAERKVKAEEGLFEEHQSGVSDVRRVGVSRTEKGGVKFDVING